MECAALKTLRLPDVRITDAAPAGPSGTGTQSVKVPHCRVTGVIGKEIRFTALLPDQWNQKFMMGGGGGFVGSVQNSAVSSINDGYATAGTDTGHQANTLQAGWALNDVERQVNFGYLAMHRTAEVVKAIIRARYGSDPTRSYFSGCSRGGGQGLMEAQRYPDDFDGIIAGAPAFDWTALTALGLRNSQVVFPNPKELSKSVVSPDNLRLVNDLVMAQCDATDGVKDGVLDDPRTCKADLAKLPPCRDDLAAADCVTRAQRAALMKLYSPLVIDKSEAYPPHPFGGEGDPAGWQNWITGVNQQMLSGMGVPSLSWAFSTEFYKYIVFNDPSWDYSKYDFSNWRKDTERVASFMNATSPDLSAFKARGGKLILWHGWADTAITPLGSIRYFDLVGTRDTERDSYFRMFLLPGVLHCGGGAGPDQADWSSAIDAWVEHAKAPDRVVATKVAQGAVTRARPLCSYPQHAVYSGSGSTDDAANFVCR
jgi:feruloyl esterase